jgi:hypothetical protein
METEICSECGQVVLTALAEPDARPMRFDATALTRWRIVYVTKSEKNAIAVPTPVHEQHSLTCQRNKKEG